jgi:hypothetical protein
MPKSPPTDPQVMSYLAVRRALGLLGLALPIVLYADARLFGDPMQPSISDFYHTRMGDFLVGTLVAIGIFLITYLGYPRKKGEMMSDQWVSTLAGLGAIGVALLSVAPPDLAACPPGSNFPGIGTSPAGITCPTQGIVIHWTRLPWIHFASAALFFGCLAIFCFFLFPKGDRKAGGGIDWSTPENRTYFACGSAILISIAALGIYAILGSGAKAALASVHYVFWWETVGVIAFAISWLTKGKLRQGVVNMISAARSGAKSG